MHRQYPYEGVYKYWEVELNTRTLIDYETATRTDWVIKNEHPGQKNQAQNSVFIIRITILISLDLYGVNKLENATSVTYLRLEFNCRSRAIAHDAVANILNTLARHLRVNQSITHLELFYEGNPIPEADVTDGLINVFQALASRSCPLIGFEITGWSINIPPCIRSVLDLICIHDTSLKHVRIECNLMAESLLEVLSKMIKHNQALKTVHLHVHLFAITEAAAALIVELIRTRNLANFTGNLRLLPESEAIIMDITRDGYSCQHSSEWLSISRQTEDTSTNQNNNNGPQATAVILPDEHAIDLIKSLPDDIIQAILNLLDKRSLAVFKKVSRSYLGWMIKSQFWRNYYLTQATSMSTDTLLAADILYGYYLNEGRKMNFWECITKLADATMPYRKFLYLPISPFHESFLDKLLNTFPELRLMNTNCQLLKRARKIVRPSKYGTKFRPLTVQFHIIATDKVIYQLNIDMMTPVTVSVMYSLAHMRNDRTSGETEPQYILDWCSASSIDETVTRMRPMVESMIVAFRGARAYCYRALPLQALIECEHIPTIHTQARDSIVQTFDKSAKSLVAELNLKQEAIESFKNCVEEIDSRFSLISSNDLAVPEYEVIHRRLDRAAYNRIYQVTDVNGQTHYWNFGGSLLDEQDAVPVTRATPKTRTVADKDSKRVKKTPQVSLICLFRKVLNLVLMPVLKSLWPRDLNDEQCAWYWFDKVHQQHDHTKSALRSWYEHYWNKWQPTDALTVSHAHPSAWPLSAIVFGSRIAAALCSAVSRMVKQKWIGHEQIEHGMEVPAFIALLEQCDLIPPKHVMFVRTLLSE